MTDNNLRDLYDTYTLPVYAPPAPVFVRGSGSYVWDEKNRDYVDFAGGVAVLSLGHAPPAMVRALQEQAAKLMHTSNLHVNKEAVLLSQLLVNNTFAKKVFLCNSGAEANEAALKLARKRGGEIHPQKNKVLSFSDGFHGRIGFAMAATSSAKVREGFGDLAPGFNIAPFNDIEQTTAAVDDNTCAIIAEPIQGEGGVNSATAEFLTTLRHLANRHDALLIFDEIQCGVGRTGVLYAYMQTEVIPDVITSAKGLGGGFPVAAMMAGDKAITALTVGSHGTTYGGNALAARVARVVLQEILSAGFLDGVKQRSEIFNHHLQAINNRFNCFADIRVCGLLIGCTLKDSINAADIVAALLSGGVIATTAANNTLRMLPALNIPFADIEEGFNRINKVLDKTLTP